MTALKRMAFYPSLFYTVAMEKVSQRTRWNRIDPNVLLGGLPFHSHIPKLVTEEQVKGVITMNERFELIGMVPKEEQWRQAGAQYLALPTPDFIASPTQVSFFVVCFTLLLHYNHKKENAF